jgi:predicted transcriptional regulator of viral defense system
VVRTSFSLGTVTRTAIALEARGWLQADSRGRYQIAPLGLLWSAERSEIRDAEMAVAGWIVTAGETSAEPDRR